MTLAMGHQADPVHFFPHDCDIPNVHCTLLFLAGEDDKARIDIRDTLTSVDSFEVPITPLKIFLEGNYTFEKDTVYNMYALQCTLAGDCCQTKAVASFASLIRIDQPFAKSMTIA
jgi:hypothetical protein